MLSHRAKRDRLPAQGLSSCRLQVTARRRGHQHLWLRLLTPVITSPHQSLTRDTMPQYPPRTYRCFTKFLPVEHNPCFAASPLPLFLLWAPSPASVQNPYPALCEEGVKRSSGGGQVSRGPPRWAGKDGARLSPQPQRGSGARWPLAASPRPQQPSASCSRLLALAVFFPALTARKGAEPAARRLRGTGSSCSVD